MSLKQRVNSAAVDGMWQKFRFMKKKNRAVSANKNNILYALFPAP
jgi:hypothetical protein